MAIADEGQVSILIEEYDDWLKSLLKEEGESSSSKHKIPKVPEMLRQVNSNQKCYEPEVVSIGPYHHGKSKHEPFKSFQKLKNQFAREYIKSCKIKPLGIYDEVTKVADEARKCYEASKPHLDDKTFTQVMFIDGCFILQYIYYCNNENKEGQAKMKMKSHEEVCVLHDLFLLENQLPFKVLKALMSLNSNFDGDKGLNLINDFIENTMAIPPEDSFVELVENFITKHITDRKRKQHTGSGSHREDEPAHLLELMHRQRINPSAFGTASTNNTAPESRGGNNYYSWLMKKPINKQGGGDNWYSYRSVKELKAAGILFRPDKKSNFFTDVRYEPLFIRGILRLLPMAIDDSIQALLLNLVAYEMCLDSPNDSGVTSYLWFMDTLIDHAEDVKELRKKGIILNYLGSDEEVARLFNEIGKNIVPNPNAYEAVTMQIEKHCKNKVRLWLTEWWHTHFSSPWTFLAFLAALLAIALSIVQTYYAVHPKK